MSHTHDVAQVIDNDEGLYRVAQVQMEQCYYIDDMTEGFMQAIGGPFVMFGVLLDRGSAREYFIENASEPIDLDDEGDTMYLRKERR